MLGFWMARVLTKAFDERSEKFRSTLLIDFLSSGVIGLLYTLIVGPLTEGVASSVAHALTPVVPHSLDIHEYTPFQRHMRPFELLSLAGAMWWGLNRSSASEHLARLSSTDEETELTSKWDTQITNGKGICSHDRLSRHCCDDALRFLSQKGWPQRWRQRPLGWESEPQHSCWPGVPNDRLHGGTWRKRRRIERLSACAMRNLGTGLPRLRSTSLGISARGSDAA